MEIVFYQNFAEKNRVNKLRYIFEQLRLDGVLRDACSVRNPVIEIEYNPDKRENYDLSGDVFVVESNGNEVVDSNGNKIVYDYDWIAQFPSMINYCYIPAWNRYYFIEDITCLNTFLYKVTLKCDVLMSFRNDILDIYGVVDRAENGPDQPANWGPLIEDIDDNRILSKITYKKYVAPIYTDVLDEGGSNWYQYVLVCRENL